MEKLTKAAQIYKPAYNSERCIMGNFSLTSEAAELTNQQRDGTSIGNGLSLSHSAHRQIRVVLTEGWKKHNMYF